MPDITEINSLKELFYYCEEYSGNLAEFDLLGLGNDKWAYLFHNSGKSGKHFIIFKYFDIIMMMVDSNKNRVHHWENGKLLDLSFLDSDILEFAESGFHVQKTKALDAFKSGHNFLYDFKVLGTYW